ncbi:MAG: hypothetical protein FJ109_04030 [Deltaproteobacteria bacterium]|nr:hypothetical protein [Deltaproteobacteria bacterium]
MTRDWRIPTAGGGLSPWWSGMCGAVLLLGLLPGLLMGCSSGGPKCEVDCAGKECGDDGCGGKCGDCDDELECTNDSCAAGTCAYALQPYFCSIAGACVPSGTVNPDNACAACLPSVGQSGFSPVEDGTSCGASAVCHEGECCDPVANCAGKECGDDGCGGKCGECVGIAECKKGKCVEKVCAPDCAGKECGDDGCSGSCGECDDDPHDVCEDGLCVCKPDCEGKECGDGGCGAKCGVCEGTNRVCDAVAGKCQCAGPKCGDGCCGPSQVCMEALTCCQPTCFEGQECGDNGCGGVCGFCEHNPSVTCVDGMCACAGTDCPTGCCAMGSVCCPSGCCEPNGVCCNEGCCVPGSVCCPSGCCPGGSVCNDGGDCCQQKCEGKTCGPDGCDGVCGVCEKQALCLTSGLCPPPGKVCNDDDYVDWDGCTKYELSEFLVNSFTKEWQTDPEVAALSGGGYVVVWTSKGQDGSLLGVFGQRIGADGFASGAEFQVNTYFTDDQEGPSAAALPGGGFVVAWESFGQDGVGEGVFFQIYKADGTKVSGETQANGFNLADQGNPFVFAHGNGFTVLWEGNGDGDWNGVWGRRFDGSGKPLGADFRLNAITAGEQKGAAGAPLTSGGFVAVWQGAGQDGNGSAIVARTFGADGNPTSDEYLLNSYTPGNQEEPVAAPLAGGGVAVAWQSLGQDTAGLGIAALLLDKDGAAVGSEFVVNTFIPGDQKVPRAAPLQDGGFVITWASKEQDGSDYGVFLRVFDAGGDAVGPEFQANVFTTSIQAHPAVAGLADGNIAVTWHSWEQAGIAYDIYATRFTPDGKRIYH